MRALSRPNHGLTGLAAVLLALPALAGPVYQWKDANGVTHYSDKPPAGQQYQDRRVDPRGEPLPQGEAVGKSVESPQCITARQNLEILKAPGPVRAADAEGKPGQELNEVQRANERTLAEAGVKAYCKPAAAPAN